MPFLLLLKTTLVLDNAFDNKHNRILDIHATHFNR